MTVKSDIIMPFAGLSVVGSPSISYLTHLTSSDLCLADCKVLEHDAFSDVKSGSSAGSLLRRGGLRCCTSAGHGTVLQT